MLCKKILLFVLLPLSLFGQADYQTILPNANAFFQAQEPFSVYDYYSLSAKLFRGVKVTETINENGFTTYRFFNEYSDDNYSQASFPYPYDNCLNMEAPCWLGEKVIVFNDGLNVFFNRYSDSIFINTQADINDSWTFYITDVGNVYNAVVTDISEKEFLGVTDFVKTITITGEGKTYTIEISQAHGFIKTINFRDFPGFEGDTYQVYEHIIKGLSEPALGYRPMTLGDVFDYENGDEIHRVQNGSGVFSGFIINKVIDRELLGDDAVVYTYEQTYWWSEPSGSGYSFDTITDTITNLSFVFDQMPFEEMNGQPERYMLDIDSYNQRPKITTGNLVFEYIDSCYKHLFEWDDLIYTYGKGVGLSEYHSEESGYSWTDMIVYFKKSDETWGTPLIPPVSVNEMERTLEINVFPNPAKDFVFIEIQDFKKLNDASISVFDISGKVVFKDRINTGNIKIDTGNWPESLFFYRISDKGVMATGKFMVRN